MYPNCPLNIYHQTIPRKYFKNILMVKLEENYQLVFHCNFEKENYFRQKVELITINSTEKIIKNYFFICVAGCDI